jgi:hypothetical protein
VLFCLKVFAEEVGMFLLALYMFPCIADFEVVNFIQKIVVAFK